MDFETPRIVLSFAGEDGVVLMLPGCNVTVVSDALLRIFDETLLECKASGNAVDQMLLLRIRLLYARSMAHHRICLAENQRANAPDSVEDTTLGNLLEQMERLRQEKDRFTRVKRQCVSSEDYLAAHAARQQELCVEERIDHTTKEIERESQRNELSKEDHRGKYNDDITALTTSFSLLEQSLQSCTDEETRLASARDYKGAETARVHTHAQTHKRTTTHTRQTQGMMAQTCLDRAIPLVTRAKNLGAPPAAQSFATLKVAQDMEEALSSLLVEADLETTPRAACKPDDDSDSCDG